MFVMNGQSGNGSGTHLPLPQKFAAFTASISSFRFHVPGFALIISMPRFTSTNFYQTRPKIKLLKTEKYKIFGGLGAEFLGTVEYCSILPLFVKLHRAIHFLGVTH